MKFGNYSSDGQARPGVRPDGRQWIFKFDNGFGASVINDGYGRDSGRFELAVLNGDRLTYSTPITDDVLGYLSADEVGEALAKIEALPAEVSA